MAAKQRLSRFLPPGQSPSPSLPQQPQAWGDMPGHACHPRSLQWLPTALPLVSSAPVPRRAGTLRRWQGQPQKVHEVYKDRVISKGQPGLGSKG